MDAASAKPVRKEGGSSKNVKERAVVEVLNGGIAFWQRLFLATLLKKKILIVNIRSYSSSNPSARIGLRDYEVNLLKLISLISSEGYYVRVDETSTKVRYNPGTLLGGEFEHDCSLDRCISYFLEPLIFFGLFGQKPLSLRLKGITNAYMERSVDTFKMSILHILKHFSVPLGSFELEIEKRGYPPLGDGVVVLKVINLPLAGTIWTDAGVIQSIRGLIYSTSVNTEYDGRMINAARTIFKDFTPDVHIYTDPKKGPFVGRSKGYGITVVAETSTRCYISADFMINSPIAVEAPRMPEEVIDRVASMLRDELLQSGVVDSKSQGFLFLLCALANGYSKIRVGELTVDGKETLEIIKDFLGERFFSKDDPTTATVLLRFRGR